MNLAGTEQCLEVLFLSNQTLAVAFVKRQWGNHTKTAIKFAETWLVYIIQQLYNSQTLRISLDLNNWVNLLFSHVESVKVVNSVHSIMSGENKDLL